MLLEFGGKNCKCYSKLNYEYPKFNMCPCPERMGREMWRDNITFTMLDIDLSTVKKSYFFDKKSLQINSL
jgi:hypothetical protein